MPFIPTPTLMLTSPLPKNLKEPLGSPMQAHILVTWLFVLTSHFYTFGSENLG